MLTIPKARPHTDAVIAAVDAAGITVGDGTGNGLTVPYCVIYSDEGTLDGPLGDRYADLEQTVFVHSVGEGREQAQAVADMTRAALLNLAADAIPGRTVLFVRPDSSQPLQRDDNLTTPTLYYLAAEYTLATTPA